MRYDGVRLVARVTADLTKMTRAAMRAGIDRCPIRQNRGFVRFCVRLCLCFYAGFCVYQPLQFA
jgi:hypothetical protein